MLRKEVLIFLGLVLSSYITSCVVAFFFAPASLANILGFLALVSYAVTLLPGMLRVVFPSLKRNQTLIWILKYRRYLGVAAFAFGEAIPKVLSGGRIAWKVVAVRASRNQPAIIRDNCSSSFTKVFI